ncbi:MAG TPA: hypothetical protein VNM45_11400 [Bacillus sp. (in: firmicutes)]|nr:hypothetical protein [Bacillus sp. (in: firmicutes)]
MREKEEKEKSVIETDDVSNRALYGSPTIGGAIVIGIIVIVVVYAAFFK